MARVDTLKMMLDGHDHTGHTMSNFRAGARRCVGESDPQRCIQVDGLGHRVTLHADGALECTGLNDDGQCSVPAGLPPVLQVGVGRLHTCALLTDGSIRCWGNNAAKQCTPPSGLDLANQIAVGQWHNLALLKTGVIVAWGKSSSGECRIPDCVERIRKVVAGDGFSAALLSNGAVIVWGNTRDRGLDRFNIVQPVMELHAGTDHLLALLADGSLACWGSNQHEQRQVPLEARQHVVAIHAGLHCNFAMTGSGKTVIWGAGAKSFPWPVTERDLEEVLKDYKFALAPTLSHSLELEVNSRDADVVKSAHGGMHFVSLLQHGAVRCGGSDALGQCRVPDGLPAVVDVAADGSWSAARTENGAVFIWGSGCATLPWPVSGEHAFNLLERSAAALTLSALNSAVLALEGVITAESGRAHAAVLFSDGRVRCWGDDTNGQCRVPNQVDGVVEICATEDWTAARGSRGGKWIWGGPCDVMPWPETPLNAGSTFLLRGHRIEVQSDGSFTIAEGCPAKDRAGIRKIRHARSIASSKEHSIALTEVGTIVCWGLNGKRKCKVPADLDKCDRVAVGDEWSAVRQVDGISRVWGYECPGLPWDMTDTDVRSLLQRDCSSLSAKFASSLLAHVPDLISSRSTTATARREAILLTTGQVLCLGDNCFGQRIVPSIPAAKRVSCGDFHTLALCVDGTVAAWGWNSSGQLDVPKDLRALDIEAIGSSSWAISLTGSLHCWGRVKDAKELSMLVTDETWLKFALSHLGEVKLMLFPEHIRKSREFKAIRTMRKLARE